MRMMMWMTLLGLLAGVALMMAQARSVQRGAVMTQNGALPKPIADTAKMQEMSECLKRCNDATASAQAEDAVEQSGDCRRSCLANGPNLFDPTAPGTPSPDRDEAAPTAPTPAQRSHVRRVTLKD
jgi:hypothetical protein